MIHDDDFSKKIDYGIKKGAYDALDRHKRLGQPIIIYKDGRIIKVPPEEIELPPFQEGSQEYD